MKSTLQRLCHQSHALMTAKTLVTVFTKKYCGLCEHVLAELEELKETRDDFTLLSRDIEERENREWKIKYHLDIPVIHINNEPVMKHGIDADLFVKLLDEGLTLTPATLHLPVEAKAADK